MTDFPKLPLFDPPDDADPPRKPVPSHVDPGCPFCGGDRNAPGHDARCDGQQGRQEAKHADAPEPDAEPAAAADDAPPRKKFRRKRVARYRGTQVQNFYDAVNSGVIKTRKEHAWQTLQRMGRATSNEVAAEMAKTSTAWAIRNTHARMTGLHDDGLVREVCHRPCRITKKVCIEWEVVPLAEYVGPMIAQRCPACRQTVAHVAMVPS